MTYVYMIAALLLVSATLYLVKKNTEVRKFLAGAFFVSSGVLLYLSLAKVSVPILGTALVQTPELAASRSAVHFVFFLLCFYFGFLKKPAPKLS
jgi:hypothetical protein